MATSDPSFFFPDGSACSAYACCSLGTAGSGGAAPASYGCGRESEPASGAEAAGEAASLAQPQRPDDHGEARATAGVTKLNLQLHLSVICYKAAP